MSRNEPEGEPGGEPEIDPPMNPPPDGGDTGAGSYAIKVTIDYPQDGAEISYVEGDTISIGGSASVVTPLGEKEPGTLDVSVNSTLLLTEGNTSSWSAVYDPGSEISVNIAASASYSYQRPGGAWVTISDSDSATVTRVKGGDGPDINIIKPVNNVSVIGPDFMVDIEAEIKDSFVINSGSVNFSIDNGSSNFLTRVGNTDTYKGKIGGISLGEHDIQIFASNVFGKKQSVVSYFTTIDDDRPVVDITSPSGNTELVIWKEGGIIVNINTTVTDSTSGIEWVKWRLDGSELSDVGLDKKIGGQWSLAVTIQNKGLHTLAIHAQDKAGNENNDAVQFDVATRYNLEDISYGSYLNDLLQFTNDRILEQGTNTKIDKVILEQFYHQPFSKLIDADYKEVAFKPVSQVRIAIEVLRSYIPNKKDTQYYSYCEKAYSLLLINLGTSYAELRRVLSAETDDEVTDDEVTDDEVTDDEVTDDEVTDDEVTDDEVTDDEVKKTFADRIGITEAGIDFIYLSPSDITEKNLQSVFGFMSTINWSIGVPDIQSSLLSIKIEKLRDSWKGQDKDGIIYKDAVYPIIDPDILTENDFKTRVEGNLAYDLYIERRNEIKNAFDSVREERKSKSAASVREGREPKLAALDGFDHVTSSFISKNLDLDRFKKMYINRIDIKIETGNKSITKEFFDNELKKTNITVEILVSLLYLRGIAKSGVVLDDEWEELYNIALYVIKSDKFSAWLDKESTSGLVLGPNLFQEKSQRPDFVKWRSTYRIRRVWEKKLDARIKQLQALKESHQAAIESTEVIVLPVLRDLLIKSIVPTEDPKDQGFDVADWLTQRLSISFKYSGNQRLTRIEQGVETVQDILQAIRIQRLNNSNQVSVPDALAKWELALFDNNIDTEPYNEKLKYDEYDFDIEWRWMGSYAAWRAAIFAFAYPENYLLPTLRRKSIWTNAFTNLVKKMRKSARLTPDKAELFAKEYIDLLKKPNEEGGDNQPYTITLTSQLTSKNLLAEELRDQNGEILVESGLRQRSKYELLDANTGKLKPNLDENRPHLKEIFFYVPMLLALSLQKQGQYRASLDWFQTVYAYELPKSQRKIYAGLEAEELINTKFSRSLGWMLDDIDIFTFAKYRKNAFTRFTLISIVRCFLAYADSEFTRESNESIPLARRLYITAKNLINDVKVVLSDNTEFPPNPVIQVLFEHADLNLKKLRKGLNIAGMDRIRTMPATVEITVENGKLIAPSSVPIEPSAYRYSALIERAKQMVGIAQQIEASYLSSFEKRDAEAYSLPAAKLGMDVASKTLEIQGKRVVDAQNQIQISIEQYDRANEQYNTYSSWIQNGKNVYERKMLNNYKEIFAEKTILNYSDTALAIADSAVVAATAGFAQVLAAAGAALWKNREAVVNSVAKGTLDYTEMKLQKNTFKANFKRQKNQWLLQKTLSENDKMIASEQKKLAKSNKQIANIEKAIATLRSENTKSVVSFLANKFTNVELYEWMSEVLGEVYSYFLQQATVMAQLAANQLAFERQEPVPTFIQGDYWQAPDSDSSKNDEGESVDRRGITGSARLLQDIYQLDQHAFETNKRKIQLVENISLAKQFPFEFQEFKKTGELSFATPLSLFDKGFPGHYLRLIKTVRITVIGLISPSKGIRATLSVAGVSRAITGNEIYKLTEIRRPSEMIAFTSTSRANGLFELQAENELLLPFEGMGVDTNWELQLPKAANYFNFDTLSDVIFSIEYTALNSFDYRQQVIQQLDRTFNAEQVYSVRNEYPDLWYHLQNSNELLDAGKEITIELNVEKDHFPPNVNDITIDNIAVYFVKQDGVVLEGENKEIKLAGINFTPVGAEYPIPLPGARTIEGLISTRRTNASSWLKLLGGSPVGQWQMVFNNKENFRKWFGDNNIKDILFIVSYSGETPAWPE